MDTPESKRQIDKNAEHEQENPFTPDSQQSPSAETHHNADFFEEERSLLNKLLNQRSRRLHGIKMILAMAVPIFHLITTQVNYIQFESSYISDLLDVNDRVNELANYNVLLYKASFSAGLLMAIKELPEDALYSNMYEEMNITFIHYVSYNRAWLMKRDFHYPKEFVIDMTAIQRGIVEVKSDRDLINLNISRCLVDIECVTKLVGDVGTSFKRALDVFESRADVVQHFRNHDLHVHLKYIDALFKFDKILACVHNFSHNLYSHILRCQPDDSRDSWRFRTSPYSNLSQYDYCNRLVFTASLDVVRHSPYASERMIANMWSRLNNVYKNLIRGNYSYDCTGTTERDRRLRYTSFMSAALYTLSDLHVHHDLGTLLINQIEASNRDENEEHYKTWIVKLASLALTGVIVLYVTIIFLYKIFIFGQLYGVYFSKILEKTNDHHIEKMRTQKLLYQMLPTKVAVSLMKGKLVLPETYDSVTVFFNDICSFYEIVNQSSPVQVAELLHRFYMLLDSISDCYDTYKVETIADSYMIVSGLPTRNGNLHAYEIACFSLHVKRLVELFEIPHLPNHQFKIRMGVHSGEVAAGVVGTRMPRFCLFGDTVNVASRMMSHGTEGEIQISKKTYKLIEPWQAFVFDDRGTSFIKGKGNMETFFLKDFTAKTNLLQKKKYWEQIRRYEKLREWNFDLLDV